MSPRTKLFRERMARAAASRAENLDDDLADRRAERFAEACRDKRVGLIARLGGLFATTAGAIARERAWLATLPFAVEGYEDVLGDNYKHLGLLGLHFEPEPRDPPAILAQLGPDWHFVDDDCSFERTGFHANRDVRIAFHKLATGALAAIAASDKPEAVIVYNRRTRA